MKKLVLLTIVCTLALALSGQSAFSAAIPVAPMDSVKIVGVKSIQIHQNSKNEYYLWVLAEMRNESQKPIKFKENDFIFSLGKLDETGRKWMSEIGKARPNEKIFKNVPADRNDVQLWKLVVGLRGSETDVLKKLAYIVNIIGDPSNIVQVGISGKTKVWRKVDNGWVSPGLLEIDLEYTPTIQKGVLFE